MSGNNFILTVVTGNYQGQEYLLKPDLETVIGRSNTADIVFSDTMVSRHHAKIVVQGDSVLLQDLNSSNGTFVDGCKITRVKVKPGDLILIGSNMLTLSMKAAGNAKNGMVPVGAPVFAVPPAKVNGAALMSGQLDQISLSDLIQLLSTSCKTGVLNVRHEDELGRFYIKDGSIQFAAIEGCPKMDPKKAVYRMMLWDSGTFELHPAGQETFEEKIAEPPDLLLLEAMQYQDEYNKVPGEKLNFGATLSVPSTQDKPLQGLAQDYLDLIELVIKFRVVRKIIYNSPLPDGETYRILTELVRDGYVLNQGVLPVEKPVIGVLPGVRVADSPVAPGIIPGIRIADGPITAGTPIATPVLDQPVVGIAPPDIAVVVKPVNRLAEDEKTQQVAKK